MSGAEQRGVPTIVLRPLTQADLPVLRPWFEDPDTRSSLGGPDWPARMLEHSRQAIGTTFRGARQIGAYHYLALVAGVPVGYIDCGTFDWCTVYGGEGPNGPLITETIDAITGAIAFTIDPTRRRQGLATRMIGALTGHADVAAVELFEAGVEPDNIGSRSCLHAAGFRLRSAEPDFEGMLYYHAWRRDLAGARGAQR